MNQIIIESSDKSHNGIFDNNLGQGLKLTLNEQNNNSEYISKLSKLILKIISNNLAKKYSINEIYAREVTRRSIVPILFFFLDRYYRMEKLIYKKKKYCFDFKSKISKFNYQQEIEENFLDYDFNNDLIFRLKDVFQLNITNEPYPKKKPEKNNNVDNKVKNHMGKVTNNRIYLKMIKFLEIFSNFFIQKKIVSPDVAHFEDSFRKKLFFLKYIKKINIKIPHYKISKDISLRKKFFNLKNNFSLTNFLINHKPYHLNKKKCDKLLLAFERFLIDYYPIQSLEGLVPNLHFIKDNYKFNNVKYYMSDGDSSHDHTILFSYISSISKIKTIRFNHGGGAGYIMDNRYSLEMVYPRCNFFISWGIKKFPNSKNIEKYYILPNPWLSEKYLYWKNNFTITFKKYDVAYMPQKIKGYNGMLEGASSYSRDTFIIFTSQFKSLISNCLKKDIKIIIKPYAPDCYEIFKDLISDLNYNNTQVLLLYPDKKSLNKELLSMANLILHDYPGSGFLESLSSNIPSLILWNKKISKEYNFFKNYFNDLKNDHIVHYNLKTLIDELINFKKHPLNWHKSKIKKKSVNRFISDFCNIDAKWYDSWIKFLYKINL